MQYAILRGLVWASALGVGLCCRAPEPGPELRQQASSERTAPADPAPDVMFAGCLSSARVPLTCSVRGGQTQLKLWVSGASEPEIQVDGMSAKASLRFMDDGSGWTVAVKIPQGAKRLVVAKEAGAAWSLPLQEAPPTPFVDAAMEAALAKAGPDDVSALTRAIAALKSELPKLDDFERAVAHHKLVLLHNRIGDRANAIAIGRKGLDFALDSGATSIAMDIAHVLQHLHLTNRDEASARFISDLTELYRRMVADGLRTTRGQYDRGRLALFRGDLRTAFDELTRAQRFARQVGLVEEELAVLSYRLPLLALFGRSEASGLAAARFLELLDDRPAERACEDAAYLSAAGWALAVSNLTEGAGDGAARLLQRSLRLFERGGGCEIGSNRNRAVARAETRFNFAFEALVRGDYEAARTRISTIDHGVLTDALRSYVAIVRARVALADGDARAAKALLLAGGGPPPDPILAWLSAVLRGEIDEALGRPRSALNAYLDAERRVDEAIAATGIDHGREGLAAGFRLAAMRAIRLQLGRGDEAAAAATARRSRARALRPIRGVALLAGLQSSARRQWHEHIGHYQTSAAEVQRELEGVWTLPAQERQRSLQRLAQQRDNMRTHLADAYAALTSAAPSTEAQRDPPGRETWLLYHPLEHGWVGFAMHRGAIRAHEIPTLPAKPDAEAYSTALLEPFASAIESATRVRILPMGDLVGVAFHALPWRGNVLVEAKPVGYALDVGRSAGGEWPQSGRALVVAEPASRLPGVGRLPRAAAEADIAARSLGAAGWTTARLARESATYTAFVAGLEGSGWLHYAGHGAAEGFAGWDSALPLAGEARLDVHAVLALERVPRTVVLSGCKTGHPDARFSAGGVHLAAAFLLAGSEFVIAATDDIADSDALALAEALYLGPPPRQNDDAMARFRSAVGAFRRLHPQSDAWFNLRVWTP